MLVYPNEFVLWNIETKKIERRFPHQGYTSLNSIVPGSSTVVIKRTVNCCPDSEEQAIAPGELRNEALVLFPRSVGPRAWDKTEQVCTRAGFRLPVVQEAPQWVTILRLVGAGMGITIAPGGIQTLARADVACRKLKPCIERSDLELAYRHGPLPPTAAAFCELARAVLQST